MALPETSLSRACRSVADFVQAAFAGVGNPIQVRLGTPAATVTSTGETDHRLNFFFHRFEPSGFGSYDVTTDPWWIRVHCIITAFGVDEEQVSAGESDLRLIGEVIRLFHERPVLGPIDVGGEVLEAQMIFQPLGLEQINQLWGSQGEVAYRPSVAYEIALVPIVASKPTLGGPLVGALGAAVRVGAVAAPPPPPPPPPLAASPPVVPASIDTAREDWAPQIAFVLPGGLAQSVSLALGSPELAAFAPRVLIAGLIGAPVTLGWDIWDAAAGWRPGGVDVAASASVAALPHNDNDDGSAAGSGSVAVTLPIAATAAKPGQAVLSARRQLTRSDGVLIEVRSNPLLVTLFGGTS